VIRFDTDQYPTRVGLTTDYSNAIQRNYLETEKGRFNLSEINSCWYRRLRVGRDIPTDMDPQFRKPSVEESRRSFIGMLTSLDAFQLDPFYHVKRAAVKQLQLKVATIMEGWKMWYILIESKKRC